MISLRSAFQPNVLFTVPYVLYLLSSTWNTWRRLKDIYQPKHCDYNNKDEVNSLNINSNNTYECVYIYIYIYIYIVFPYWWVVTFKSPCIWRSSKSFKPYLKRKALTEHFCNRNTLTFLINLEKLIQISFSISVQLRPIQRWEMCNKSTIWVWLFEHPSYFKGLE